MFETLKRIYAKSKNVNYLENAIKKGWITAAEKKKIIAEIE